MNSKLAFSCLCILVLGSLFEGQAAVVRSKRQTDFSFPEGDDVLQGLNSQQQAGANTHSEDTINEAGHFQGNSGSSISSNIQDGGASGEVSSANTAQQAYETANESGKKNAAQSQSVNFGKDSKQASAANADTSQIKTADSEKIGSHGAAMNIQQSQFGSSSNTAQTNTETFKENGQQGSKSDASSQSQLQGINGGISAANTGAQTSSIQGPNGSTINKANSQASSVSQNGGPAVASASASAGSGPNGGFSNAFGGGFSNPFGGQFFNNNRQLPQFGNFFG